MKLNLPNQITLGRLILAVVFCILLTNYSYRDGKPWLLDLAAALFIVAAITDFLDGYLARKYAMVTDLGRVLDPLADKVLVCGAFILFLGPAFVDESGRNVTGLSAWMVVVIVARELLITTLRGFSEARGIAFGAMIHGKIKMWVQSIAAPVILVIVAHQGTLIDESFAEIAKKVLVWATVIATVLSMIQYLVRARHVLSQGTSA
jgi:CDP-diacylglycerol--glycerol-3-phosphate 3-phosphatidyltransferase